MRSLFIAFVTALAFGLFAAAPLLADPSISPAKTRQVILEKAGAGYRWKLIEAPVPAVGDHQVLVRVRSVALHRGDLEVLEPDEQRDRSGLVACSDAAGDVVAVGKRVTGIGKGARVTSLYFRNWVDGAPSKEKLADAHGASVDGVLGDYIILEDTAVAPAPNGLSYEEAATLPTAGLTAWSAVNAHGEIRPGDVVLVQGTGGVSAFATQFAAAMGGRVIVTSSSDDKLRRALALGARDGINYRTEPAWSDRVFKLTQGHGADLAIDIGGKDTLAQSVKSLAYAGTVAIVGGMSGYDGNVPAAGLLLKAADARGVNVGSRADYLRMSAFIAKHQLHPVIDRVFPFEQYDEALKYLATGSFVGKIVLRL